MVVRSGPKTKQVLHSAEPGLSPAKEFVQTRDSKQTPNPANCILRCRLGCSRGRGARRRELVLKKAPSRCLRGRQQQDYKQTRASDTRPWDCSTTAPFLNGTDARLAHRGARKVPKSAASEDAKSYC